MLPHRCPRCGTRLVRRVAVEEAYTLLEDKPMFGSGDRAPWPPPSHGLIEKRTRIPVYLECPKCGFQMRMNDIKS